ncbi:MAG: WD40 repeat domain-containing protein [Ilumatobacteraceae bacterium]
MAHRSPITTIDQHAASGLVATGSYDGCVIAWADGAELWSVQFADLVNDVRIDPSGERIAVADADGYAYVLDVATGAYLSMLGPHLDDVNAVRWSPDGSELICLMDHLDTAVRVWSLADASWTSRTLTGHESGVFAAARDPRGERLATVAEDATARVWDLASGKELHILRHPGDPEALDWSPDGAVVVTGCDDGVLRVWSPDTGELVRELTEATAAVRFLRFSADGTRLLAGAYDATLRVYDVATWQVTHSFRRDYQWERAACFAGDDVLVGSFAGAPMLQSLTGGPTAMEAPLVLTYGINGLDRAHGQTVIGRDDGAIVDVVGQRIIEQHPSIVNTVAISPDGRTVASADYRGGLSLTPVDAERHDGRAVRGAANEGGPINSVVWHPSGEHLYTAGYDGVIRRWTPAAECVAQWQAHHSPIKSIAWSAAANLIVAGSSDGSLSAWRDGVEVWRARADDLVLVNSVAVADSDGTGVVVSASRDLRVRRWDVHTGVLLETLPQGHSKSVKAIDATADGGTILTGSYDGTVIIWSRGVDGTWSWRPLRAHGKPGVPAVSLGEGLVLSAGWDTSVCEWSHDGALVQQHHIAETR